MNRIIKMQHNNIVICRCVQCIQGYHANQSFLFGMKAYENKVHINIADNKLSVTCNDLLDGYRWIIRLKYIPFVWTYDFITHCFDVKFDGGKNILKI